MQGLAQRTIARGVRIFAIVWLGQFVSLVGSGLTEFSLGVWVFQRTGSPTQFVLTIFFFSLPRILLSPLAGTLVDRWDRRWAMILSDAGAGLCTLAIALLLFSDRLEVWQIYLILIVSSAFSTFQWPAYAATTTLLIPKEHLGRANGMIQVAYSTASLLSPVLAGFLVVTVGLAGVVLIDVATFLFAVLTLLLVRFPRPEISQEGAIAQGSLLREAASGWAYITRRPGLLGLLILYAATSFLGITTEVLLTPYILSFSTADVLGLVISATGGGLLTGGLIMGAWGGPRRRIYGIVGFEMMVGICAVLIGLGTSAFLIGVVVFFYFVFIAMADSCSEALWQTKVIPDFQGRVFAMRRMISLSALPLGLLIAAPLAEHLLEPLLAEGGRLAGNLGQLVGVGPGRGIGLLFVIGGVFNILVLIAGYLHPRVRLVEDELPDAVLAERGLAKDPIV